MHEVNILEKRKQGRENHYRIKDKHLEHVVSKIIAWKEQG
jgi:hypothetical protein